MKSGHVIDTDSRARQLTTFFRQSQMARAKAMQSDADEKHKKVIEEAENGKPGKIMSSSEIITKLQLLNSSLIFMQSTAYPEQGGIYIRDGKSNMDDVNPFYRGIRMISAMGWGLVPENTVWRIETNEKGDKDPHIAKKGWRTTLANLISLRLITLSGAERLFGIGGEKWHERLH